MINIIFLFCSLFNLCFSETLFRECTCYNSSYWDSDEIGNINYLLKDYEKFREKRCFLSDNLSPHTWNTRFHKEIERLNSLAPLYPFPCRYPDVYKRILISDQKLDVIKDFWIMQDEYEINKLKPYDYPLPSERGAYLVESKSKLEKRVQDCRQKLNECTTKILNEFIVLFEKCMEKHTSIVTYHDYGLFCYLNNDFDKATKLLCKTIEIAEEEGRLPDLDAQIYHNLGSVCLESLVYDKAIKYLTEAINKNPQNKEIYYDRATAYFETGAFDLAIQDFLTAGINDTNSFNSVSPSFSNALLLALASGAADGVIDYVPSLCNSLYGISEAMWVTVSHPVNSTTQFVQSCQDMSEAISDYCKNVDWDTIEEYSEQIKTLSQGFKKLSDEEKGQLIGYAIGKYGVEIFAGGAICKGITAYRNLRNANRLCNLEALTVSQANKEAMVATAVKKSFDREAYFKNIKYNWSDHNKHVPGHKNFLDKKSVWSHNDPEGLLRQYAGKGQPIRA